jgi:hypothetical protein
VGAQTSTPSANYVDQAPVVQGSIADDLKIEVFDNSPYGLAIRLRNDALEPVEHCRIFLTRLDRYVPQKQNFTRNPCEPMTVLYVRHVNGQAPSHGFTFAVYDLNFATVRFNSEIAEFRRSPSPELTQGTWLVEFTLQRKDDILKKTTFFIEWVSGAKPQLVDDPGAVGSPVKRRIDAQVLSDRAWVLIERDSVRDRIQDPYLPTDEQLILERRMLHCILFCKNVGKTLAKITGARFELEVSDNPNVPPSSPAYDAPEVFSSAMLLPPDGSAPFEARINSTHQMMQECVNVKNGIRSLWLCGIIKYIDIFECGQDSEHETRFCYVWETRMNSPFWSKRGDANYNNCT